jgi:hypothetical protein
MQDSTTRHPNGFARLVDVPAIKTRATRLVGGKKCHSYKPLPKEFRRDGFTHTLIAREGNVAIYEQCSIGSPDPSVCYEVIRIRRRESFQIEGRLIEASEIYPRPEDWGSNGWTMLSRDAAFDKLREVCM